MKSVRDLASIVLGLAILAAMGAGVYFAGAYVVELFRGLDPQVADLIYAAVIAAAGGAFLVSLIVRWGGRRSAADRLRLERAQAYRQLVDALSGVLGQTAAADPQTARRAEADLDAAERGLMVLGSDNAVKYYTAFRKLDPRLDPRDPAVQPAIERLLRELRTDLGHGNAGVGEGDLLGLLLGNGPAAARIADVAAFEQRTAGEGPLR